jgi:hypothetical protein
MRRRAGTEHTERSGKSGDRGRWGEPDVCAFCASWRPWMGVGREKAQEAQGFNRKTGKCGKMLMTWDLGDREGRTSHSVASVTSCSNPACEQEPTEETEAEAIRVNARKNRVTAAAGVSPMFAPAAPLGGHGRSWPRKGSGGAGFEQEDLEVREDVKTWETSESRKAHSCKFVSLRG